MKSRRRRLLLIVLTLVLLVSMQSLVLGHSAGCIMGGSMASRAPANAIPSHAHCLYHAATTTAGPACATHCHSGEIARAKAVPHGVPPCTIPKSLAPVAVGVSIAMSIQHATDARSADSRGPPPDLPVQHCSLLI